MLHLEQVTYAELLDLLFQQLFDGFVKGTLDFADADGVDLFVEASLDQMLCEEVAFPRSTAAVYALISCRAQERKKYPRSLYVEDRQWFALSRSAGVHHSGL